MHRHTVLALCASLAFMVSVPAEAAVFSGSLSSAAGEIQGVGSWIDPGVTTIAWEVADLGTHYHYKYTLTVPGHEVSHFIIEVSSAAVSGEFSALQGPFSGTPGIGDFDQSNGNPDIPDAIHGLKFDNTWGTTAVFEFDSVRVPVWGDFYAKGGGKPANQAWNAGLAAADPTAPVSSGSVDCHLLVPDSQVVPEPATALLALAAAGLLRRRSVRR